MMIMGYGYYGNGVSSSSSSNLSAAAPPFTVDRSVPKPFSPLIDFTDHSSVHDFFSINTNNSAEFEPIPSSIDYTNSPSVPHVTILNSSSGSADDIPYSRLPATHPEPSNPKYQPFISSETCNSMLLRHSGHEILHRTHGVTPSQPSGDSCFAQTLDHTSHWSGLWKASDWLQNSQVQLDDGRFVSRDNYMNEGPYAPKEIYNGKGFNGIDADGSEKHVKHSGSEQMDSIPVLSENPEFVCTDYSTALTCTPTLPALRTHSKVVHAEAGGSRGYETPLTASFERCSRKQFPSSFETQSVMKSPSVTIRPPHQDMFSLKAMRPQIGEVKDFGCSNPITIKDTHPCRKTESKPDIDARQLEFRLGKNEELTSNTSVSSQGPFVAKPGFQVPHVYPDGFSVVVDNKSFSPADNIAESFDHHSSALDSPCWKGASNSYRSRSEVARSYNMRKVEDISGTSLLGPEGSPFTPNPADVVNPRNLVDCEMRTETRGPDEWLAPIKGLAGANMFAGEGIGGAVKFQACNKIDSCSPGLQLSYGICVPNKGDNLFCQSVESFDGEAPKKQTTGEGKGTAVKHAGSSDADLETDKSDDPEHCSSQVPFHAIEHVLLSPSSADGSPYELTRQTNRQSAPYVYIQTLVNSMHDLSKLLLLHCSNEACELADEDCETLKEVLKNVHSSVANKAEGVIPMEQLLIPKRQHRSRAIRKGPNVVARQGQGLSSAKFSSSVKALEDHSTWDGLRDEKLPNYETVKHGSMTQAIKKIIAENLHNEDETQPEIHLYKNLWLEAEAQLCSVNHVARYNRMRIEMEKGHSQQLNVLPENTTAMGMFRRPEVSSDIFAEGTFGLDINSRQVLDSPDPDTSISSAISNPDDTLARSHVIKSPIGNSIAEVKFPDDKEAGKATREVRDGAKTDVFIQESPLRRNIGNTNDVEASVMTRFQILKCRAGSLRSRAIEEHWPEGDDLAYLGLRGHRSFCKDFSENISKNGKVKTSLQNSPVKCTEERLVVEEKSNKQKGNGTVKIDNRPGAWFSSPPRSTYLL